MNKKISAILIALGMVAPLLGGCAPAEEVVDPTIDDTVVVEPVTPDMETPAEIDTDYFEITPVSTTAVSEFSDATMAALRKAMDDFGIEDEEDFVKMLLNCKFSNEQAALLAKLMSDVREIVQDGDPSADFLKELFSTGLSLINSVNNEQLSAVLSAIELSYKDSIRANIDEVAHEWHDDFHFGTAKYSDLEDLRKLSQGLGNDELTRRVNIIDDVYKNLAITEEQQSEIRELTANYQAKLNRGLFPSEASAFIKEHGTSLTSYLVKAIQVLGGQFVEKYRLAIAETPTHQVGISIYDYNDADRVTMNDILNSFTYSDLKNMAIALFGKCENNVDMFNVVRKVVLPTVFNVSYSESEEVRTARNQLLSDLNSFTETSLDTTLKFVITVLKEFNEEEFTSLKSGQYLSVVKGKVSKLLELVNGLSQKEKDDIQQFGNIVNIDIFGTLSEVLTKVATTDFEKEDEAEAFNTYITELGGTLKEKLNTFVASIKDSDTEEEVAPASTNYSMWTNKSFYVGDVAVVSDVSIYKNDSFVDTAVVSSIEIDTSKAGYATLSVTFTETAESETQITLKSTERVYPVIEYADMLSYSFYPQKGEGEGESGWKITTDENNIMYAKFVYYENDLGCVTTVKRETVGVYVVGQSNFSVTPRIYFYDTVDMGYGIVKEATEYHYCYKYNVPEVDFSEVGVHQFTYGDVDYRVETFEFSSGTLHGLRIYNGSEIIERLETESDFSIELAAYATYAFHGELGDVDVEFAIAVTLEHVARSEDGVISFEYNNEIYHFTYSGSHIA